MADVNLGRATWNIVESRPQYADSAVLLQVLHIPNPERQTSWKLSHLHNSASLFNFHLALESQRNFFSEICIISLPNITFWAMCDASPIQAAHNFRW